MALVANPRKVAVTATASAALAKGRHTPVNATSGNLAMTLPTGAVEGSHISVEKIDASANTVTVTGNIRGAAATTLTLSSQFSGAEFVADSSGSWWPTGSSSSGGSGLADGSVTSAKIADGAVVAGDLAPNAVTTAKITDASVTSPKIADGAISPAKLDSSTPILVLYTGTAWPTYSTDPNKVRQFRSEPYSSTVAAPTAYNIYDTWWRS